MIRLITINFRIILLFWSFLIVPSIFSQSSEDLEFLRLLPDNQAQSISEKLGIQPKVITELFFPDPDIDIPTPGFLKKKGYTNFMELRAFLKQKGHSYSWSNIKGL